MKIPKIVAIWIAWLFLGFIPTFAFIPGVEFYASQVLSSLVLVFFLHGIDDFYGEDKVGSRMISIICYLTALFGFLSLCTGIGFKLGNYVLYDSYVIICNTINILELAVLTIGSFLGIADARNIKRVLETSGRAMAEQRRLVATHVSDNLSVFTDLENMGKKETYH